MPAANTDNKGKLHNSRKSESVFAREFYHYTYISSSNEIHRLPNPT
jgi:hypothetical protein